MPKVIEAVKIPEDFEYEMDTPEEKEERIKKNLEWLEKMMIEENTKKK